MFVVEFKTIGSFGISYPSNFANVSDLKALSCEDAANYILKNSKNIEIVAVDYVGCL